MNAQKFSTFLDNLSVVLDDEETFVIMDNAPCHQRAEMPDENRHMVRELPPYSPVMNPIEEAFSALKAAIKARLNEPDIQQQLMDPRGHVQQQVNAFMKSHVTCAVHVGCMLLFKVTLLECRMRILQDLAREVLDNREAVNAEKCTAFNRHMMTDLPRCLNGDDILH